MNADVLPSSWSGIRQGSATSGVSISLFWDRPLISNVLVSTDALGKRASEVLGINGIERFEEFKQYKDGWDHGKGKALSYRSVAIMERMMNQFQDFPCEPSLFFTREGNLQLGWDDNDGNSVELEFCPDSIEYYIESEDLEGEIGVNEPGIKSLISYL